MTRLLSLIYSLAATVLVGVCLVVTLVAGFVSGPAIVAAIASGAVLAAPVAYIVARKLYDS